MLAVGFPKLNNGFRLFRIADDKVADDKARYRVRIAANRGCPLAGRRDAILLSPRRGETLKNDGGRAASLSFIYNPHLIIIQSYAHHARKVGTHPSRLAGERATNDRRR